MWTENQSWSGRGSLDVCKTSWQTSLLERWQLQIPRWKDPNLHMSSQPAVYGLQYVVNHTDIVSLHVLNCMLNCAQIVHSFARHDSTNERLSFEFWLAVCEEKQWDVRMDFKKQAIGKRRIQIHSDFFVASNMSRRGQNIPCTEWPESTRRGFDR